MKVALKGHNLVLYYSTLAYFKEEGGWGWGSRDEKRKGEGERINAPFFSFLRPPPLQM